MMPFGDDPRACAASSRAVHKDRSPPGRSPEARGRVCGVKTSTFSTSSAHKRTPRGPAGDPPSTWFAPGRNPVQPRAFGGTTLSPDQPAMPVRRQTTRRAFPAPLPSMPRPLMQTPPATALRQGRQARAWPWPWPVAVLLAGGLVTTGAALRVHQEIDQQAQTEFEHLVHRIAQETERRFKLPVYGLMGARGAYAASLQLSGAQFRAYVESRDLSDEFPGIRGFGFIQRVLRDDLPRFQAAVRAEGAQAFSVNATGTAADLYVIRYIEPLATNLPAWGYDLGSDPKRRSAIETAILAGRPTLSERVTLLQDAQQGPRLPLPAAGLPRRRGARERRRPPASAARRAVHAHRRARDLRRRCRGGQRPARLRGLRRPGHQSRQSRLRPRPDGKPAVAGHPRARLRPALRNTRLAHHRRSCLRAARQFAAHVRQRLQSRRRVGCRAGRCRAHVAGRLGRLAAGRRTGTHPEARARTHGRPGPAGADRRTHVQRRVHHRCAGPHHLDQRRFHAPVGLHARRSPGPHTEGSGGQRQERARGAGAAAAGAARRHRSPRRGAQPRQGRPRVLAARRRAAHARRRRHDHRLHGDRHRHHRHPRRGRRPGARAGPAGQHPGRHPRRRRRVEHADRRHRDQPPMGRDARLHARVVVAGDRTDLVGPVPPRRPAGVPGCRAGARAWYDTAVQRRGQDAPPATATGACWTFAAACRHACPTAAPNGSRARTSTSPSGARKRAAGRLGPSCRATGSGRPMPNTASARSTPNATRNSAAWRRSCSGAAATKCPGSRHPMAATAGPDSTRCSIATRASRVWSTP
jgi:hypothetical protein